MRKFKYFLVSLITVALCVATVLAAACTSDTEPEPEPELQSITVSYTGGAVPHNTAVEDLTGITVTAKYNAGNDKTLTKGDYTLFGTLVPDTESRVLVIYKDKMAEFSVTVNPVPEPEPETFDYVASINGVHYDTFAKAVEYANAHAYSEILIVGQVESGEYELNESVSLTGHENAPVLNDTRFIVKTDKNISFNNLKFSGDSNITTAQGANIAGILSIDNCYADVQTYQNGKGEFIHLTEGYGFKSNFNLTNSTVICSGNDDDATQAVWGDGNIRNAVIKGNTFGTPDHRMSRYVVKFMRLEADATVEISRNVVYGTTTDKKPFAILDVYDRNEVNIASVTFAHNELDVVVNGEQGVYLALFEKKAIAEVNLKGNKFKNELFSELSILGTCTVTKTNDYDKAD